MIYQSPKNPNSHLTFKERRWPSFPTKQLFQRNLIRGRVLDFGSGTGVDVTFLKEKDFDVTAYDPYHAPEIPTGKFDTILCNYVLNILLPKEQAHVLMAISELLAPTGRAYFAVRRDIKKNGFRLHTKRGVKVYQCNVVLPYSSVLAVDHCEIYEYCHFNQIDYSQIDCPFCCLDSDRELITESATVCAIFDKYPVSPGHALIVPKQHLANYFGLSDRTKTACWLVIDRVKMLLTQRFDPDGFNVGINVGQAAGQTISHVHIHLIPRYIGDVSDPTGGIRHVISEKGNYLA